MYVWYNMLSYPRRRASSAVCVGADGILFGVVPLLSRSLEIFKLIMQAN